MYRTNLSQATPPRSRAQRMAALKRANEIRSHRATVKRDIKAGRTTIAAVLDDPLFATAKVYDVLVALPKVGRVKASNVMTKGRMSPSKTCAGLTDRQRAELVELLSERGLR